MQQPSRRRAAAAVLAMALAGFGACAAAQSDYPNRPVRIIVANTPGSTVDLIARKLGDGLAQALGQPVVIVNQPGAGGLLGQQAIAQAAKDGYTLGFYATPP